MDKNIITFQANEQELIVTTPKMFASDTVSYIEARFELGENWGGFDSVRAVWSNGYERISTVLNSLGVCIVPTEVLTRRADVLMNLVGSIAENGELTDRLTTFPVIALRVTKKAMVEGTETAPVTPSQFEQFAEAVRQDADRAEAGASEAEGYRDEALQIKTDVQGLRADVVQLKADTEQLKDDTASIKADVEALADGFDDTVADAVEEITTLADTKKGEITSLGDDKKTEISSLADSKKAEITQEGTTQKGLVSAEGTTQLNAIRTEGSSQLSAIRTEGTTQKGLVTTEGQTQVANVQAEGQTQIDAIQTEGEEQIQAIEDKGQEVISLIPYMAPVIVDSASGDIATFPDGADDYPLKSLKVNLEPIQDLHGQEYPYPAGGGINKFDVQSWATLGTNPNYYTVASDGKITVNSIDYGGIGRRLMDFAPNTRYKIVQSGFNYVNVFTSASSQLSQDDFTIPEDGKIAIKPIPQNYPTTGWVMIVPYDSTATAYAPYSNICPISGWDEVRVEQRGKNLFDKNATDTSNGYMTGYWLNYLNGETSGSYNISEYIAVKENTQYTVSGTYGSNPSVCFYNESKTFISGQKYNSASSNPKVTFTTPSGTEYIRLSLARDMIDICQLELGSTATDFEPYQGNTYPISLPSTVYGGEVSVVDGEGKSTMGMVDLGSLNWSYIASYQMFRTSFPSAKAFAGGLCSMYRRRNTEYSDNNIWYIGGTGWFNGDLMIRDTSYTTASEFKQAMNGVQLCYELATPTDLSTTPTEIKSLFGSNNIWSNGEVSVEYCADTKLYIDKKLG